jgi:hypothetical protein
LCDSINGRLRDECLNGYEFASIDEASSELKCGGSTTASVDRMAHSTIRPRVSLQIQVRNEAAEF